MNNIHTYQSFNESRRSLPDLEIERDETEEEIKQLRIDMEEDPDISNPNEKTANDYGTKLNVLDDKLEKINAQINKAENPKARATKSDAYKKIKKNMDDVLRSKRTFPTRTKEEAAVILKKRYNIVQGSVVDALTELGVYE